MEVQVTLVQRYGQRVVIPACEKAHIFCNIAKTATLTPHTIDAIKQLGYKIVVIPSEPAEL